VEVVADEHPGGDRAEQCVDQDDDERRPERELQRFDGIRVREDLPEAVRAALVGFPDERRDRQDDDDEQVRRDDADGKARAGPSVGADPARDPFGRCGEGANW
jgi:hypothetical protein